MLLFLNTAAKVPPKVSSYQLTNWWFSGSHTIVLLASSLVIDSLSMPFSSVTVLLCSS